jgi:hypothetical protein
MFMEQPGDSMFEFIFHIFPYLFGAVFVLILGSFLFILISNLLKWQKNNNQPKLNVDAKVITKRTEVSGGKNRRTYNNYYVTFEVESGDRMELLVKGNDFGVLAEGDEGELHFQGTRYLGFTRNTVK